MCDALITSLFYILLPYFQLSPSIVSKREKNEKLIRENKIQKESAEPEDYEIINAFIGAIQYNTEVEGVSSEAFDIEGLDLNKVYYLISPMFYNVRLKNIQELVGGASNVMFVTK